ncbi:MAG: DUF1543 domain-containing protein [Candidatus Neomarinimicrobiota bacterium]
MKLFLVHLGYYDEKIEAGFYESHTNIFVCARDEPGAQKAARENKLFKKKGTHIDSIMEVNQVNGFDIMLKKNTKLIKNKNYMY